VDAHKYRDRDPHADGGSDRYAHSDADAHSHRGTHGDADAHTHAYANPY
jgi:hypothetical protein